MKKISFLLLFLTTGIFAFAQDVKVTHNLPESVGAGQSFDMDVTLTKGNIGSFAKFQSDLPPGFTASSVDSKGGNFTFENQRVKIVWVAVPSDPSFTFKVKIAVPADAPPACAISAKFFYLENNVKKEYEIPTHNLKITGSGSTATNTETTPTNTVTATSTETTPTNTVTSTSTETVPTNTVTSTSTETVPTNTVTSTETTPTNTVSTTPTNTVTSTSTETVPTNTVSTTPVKTENVASSNESAKTADKKGVVYKVQIGAFTNSPSKSKFPGVSIVVNEEAGMYKALSGSFSTEAEATKYRDNLAAKGYPGFVVVYENGKRIRFIH